MIRVALDVSLSKRSFGREMDAAKLNRFRCSNHIVKYRFSQISTRSLHSNVLRLSINAITTGSEEKQPMSTMRIERSRRDLFILAFSRFPVCRFNSMALVDRVLRLPPRNFFLYLPETFFLPPRTSPKTFSYLPETFSMVCLLLPGLFRRCLVQRAFEKWWQKALSRGQLQ